MGNIFGKETEVALKDGEFDIGNYRVTLTEDIGSGSFGTVFQAINRQTKEKLAVKKIKYKFGTEINDELRNMAETEAESMKMVRHPHIVSLLDYKIANGSAWLFMPFCDCGDLNRYLSNNADMSIGKRFIMMHQLANAVSCLHRHNPPIIHRDIKPGNVLVKSIYGADCAMLTDFGYAKLYDYNMSIAGSLVYRDYHESLKGTPSFMAPEFFMEDPSGLKYTATVDIFSLGLMYSIIFEYSQTNQNLYPMSVKAKREKKVVNFGFEMSECYKRSDTLPYIVQHDANDNERIKDLKELILEMTAFDDHDRIHIGKVEGTLKRIVLSERLSTVQANSLAFEMIGRKLTQVKNIQISDHPWSLKLIDGEIWSCQRDGVLVYDTTLAFVRRMKIGYAYDVALLPGGNVVIAGGALREMSKSGDFIKKILSKIHSGVAVQNDKCYACPSFSSRIDVYGCSDWQLLRSMQLPGCDNHCWKHTISVSGQYIKVCCRATHRLTVLNLDGKVKSIHGPQIEIKNNYSVAANRDGSIKSRLLCPLLCQEDDEGNMFITDEFNGRLLLFTADNIWLDVTPDAGFKRPIGAVCLKGRLYVSSGYNNEFITMFE